MISAFFIIVVLLYCVLIIRLTYQLLYPSRQLSIHDYKNYNPNTKLPFITIIICYRNEENALPALLKSISEFNYPVGLVQIILADDGSDDKSMEIVRNTILKYETCTIGGYQGFGGKKYAITQAIKLAKGSYIFATDADCILPPDLLYSYAILACQKNAAFISGPVMFESSENDLISQMMQIEFASLIGVGAATIGLSSPTMCNGANLFFSKAAFEHVKGYESDIDYHSGDDVFLMQKIHLAYPESVFFMLNDQTLVRTFAPRSVHEFYNQRLRWAGKFGGYDLASPAALAGIGVVVFYSLLLSMPVFSIIGLLHWLVMIVLLIIKILADFLFFQVFYNRIKFRFNTLSFLLLQPIYPFYVIWFGIIGFFRVKYEWKGRKLN